MKLRFFDVRNCYSLLPKLFGLHLAGVLDAYVKNKIDEKQGEMHGSVDELIKHNGRTINRKSSSQRLCNSPIEIVVIYNAARQGINLLSHKRPFRGPANFQMVIEYDNGLTWKTVVPLQFLLKGWGDANNGYQCYVHSISQHIHKVKSYADMLARYETASDDYHYVGITGRNWLHRFREHMGDMGRGSRLKFHRAWRSNMGKSDVHFISQLQEINMSFEDAMNWEERNVDKLGANGLNMIPGGFKGLRHLYEHRITDRIDISLEERDKAIVEFVRRNPRKGIPNPFIAELWKDDEFYLKVIEARPKTLSPSQVKKIRELEKIGRSITEIAEEVGALNQMQVKNVIAGRTYGRIH